MATQRMKLDYNHLMELVYDFLNKNHSEDNDRDVVAVDMGFGLLNVYLKEIAERALEIKDEVLIELFKDLYLLVEEKSEKTKASEK